MAQGHAAGRPSLTFSDPALQRLRGYEWPGNVRELANLVERSSILCSGGYVDAQALPAPIGDSRAVGRHSQITDIPSDGLDLRAHLVDIERELIRRALDQSNGTVAKAARLLNLRRTTLVEKLRKYDFAASDGFGTNLDVSEPSTN